MSAKGPNLVTALAEQEAEKWRRGPMAAIRRLSDDTYESVSDWPDAGCGKWTTEQWVAWGRAKADLAGHLFTDALEIQKLVQP